MKIWLRFSLFCQINPLTSTSVEYNHLRIHLKDLRTVFTQYKLNPHYSYGHCKMLAVRQSLKHHFITFLSKKAELSMKIISCSWLLVSHLLNSCYLITYIKIYKIMTTKYIPKLLLMGLIFAKDKKVSWGVHESQLVAKQ